MQHDNDHQEHGSAPGLADAGRRRHYDRPRIISKERLEVMATTCDPTANGKDSFGSGTCTLFTQS